MMKKVKKLSRNQDYRFDLAPQALIPRSTHRGLSHSIKTTFNAGDIVPFYVEPVYPGDTFDVSTSKVIRLQTLLSPLMDNMFLDTMFFFVPNRLIWEHWEQFIGGAIEDGSPWIPVPEYTVPQIISPVSGGFSTGSLADYLGYPTGVASLSASALPVRAYGQIINDWFISGPLTEPYLVPTGDSDVQAVASSTEVNAINYAIKPVKACKMHDYFTSCLPAPQRGPDTPLPLGDISPVFAGDINTSFDFPHKTLTPDEYIPMSFQSVLLDPDEDYSQVHSGILAASMSAQSGAEGMDFCVSPNSTPTASGTVQVYPTNLYTDLRQATATSINALRIAFQIQKLHERDARGAAGGRYVEMLKAHFGVTSPDARLQRAEYLGGSRFPIKIHQVTQTSSTAGAAALGDTAAMSVTADMHRDFVKSFVEHGLIIGVMICRYEHSYQNSLPRFMSAKTRYDWYFPVLSSIGEQAVKVKEIYCDGSANDELVFGYQEAWADLRYHPNRITGEMRSNATNSLDYWHLADDYASMPYLSDEWIREDESNVDRVLAVSSAVANQLFGDIYLDIKATRPIPLFSVPGLIDHF